MVIDPSTGRDGHPRSPDAEDDWRRHPADVARLVTSATTVLVLVLAAGMAPGAVRTFSIGVVDVVRLIPAPIRSFLLGLVQLAAMAGPVAVALWLLRGGRLRLLAVSASAGAVAAGVLALLQGWLDDRLPRAVSVAQDADSWLVGAAFPSGAYLAGLAAVVVTLGAATTRDWRRVGVAVVVLAALVRIATAVAVPLNVGISIAIGAAVGSLVLVVTGAPARRISPADVMDAVAALGIDAASIGEVGDRRGNSRTFRLTDPEAFVKVFGRDERAAELFARGLRALRVRGLEDDRARWSAVATARNEALAGLLADSAGVGVAPVLAVGGTEAGDGVTVLGAVGGTTLASMAPESVDDDLLDGIWRQVGRAHDARLAHRWLDSSHVLVGDGPPRLVDWRWATIGARSEVLAVDVADLLVSTAAVVGIERAVASARRELGEDRLAAAIPLIQPLVLSVPNRRVAKQHPDLVGDLRAAVAEAVGADDVAPAPLARLSVARVVGWFGVAVLAYIALGFASNLEQIGDALGDADWSYLVPLLLTTVVGTVGGALSLSGVVPQRLPFLRTVQVMYAQSFLNRFTPANAGGMALRVKYLQANGADLAVAVAGVGITSVASGVMQVVVFVVVALWAGRSDSLDFDLPDLSGVAPMIAMVLIAAGVVALTPWGRRMIFGSVVPRASLVVSELRKVAADPTKLLLLFGGALCSKAAGLTAFVLSARALGVDESTAVLCLLFMTANTVAAAAPTPGGVGAIEAALVTVLTGVGVEAGVAISVVVVFRLVTYWLPVIPAYIALHLLRRTDIA